VNLATLHFRVVPDLAATEDDHVARDNWNVIFAMNEKGIGIVVQKDERNFSFDDSSPGEILLILDVINMWHARLGEMSDLDLGIVTFLDRFSDPNSFQAINKRSVNFGHAMHAIAAALLGCFNFEKVIQLGVGEKTLDDLECRGRRDYGSEIGKESDSDSDGELHDDENCNLWKHEQKYVAYVTLKIADLIDFVR
jgi:hypothetical protein